MGEQPSQVAQRQSHQRAEPHHPDGSSYCPDVQEQLFRLSEQGYFGKSHEGVSQGKHHGSFDPFLIPFVFGFL